jgi:hypothetical protein
MPSAGFEPVIPTSDRPQTDALGRAATGIGSYSIASVIKQVLNLSELLTVLSETLTHNFSS